MIHEIPEFPLLELRRYIMKRGRRDELADWFDREFIAELEALPIRVLGQFRDPERPDLWIWLRAFRNQSERGDALSRFYTSPFWKQRRTAVNATLISSDDVHLLRPAWPGSALRLAGAHWPPAREGVANGALWVRILPASSPRDDDGLQHAWGDIWDRHAALETACYDTEPTPNSYPRLPVHDGPPVRIVFALFQDQQALDRALQAGLDAQIEQALYASGNAPAYFAQHRLIPTAKSALRAR